MLQNTLWIRYEHSLHVEFEQCLMEGRDVEKYRPLVEAALKVVPDVAAADREILIRIGEMLANAPIRADYPFVEPNDLDGILAASPSAEKAPELPAPVTGDAMLGKLKGAWIGRIAGCLLGKPVEGWRRNLLYPVLEATDNYPMKKYIRASEFPEDLVKKYSLNTRACFADNVHYASPPDDDTNYTVFALKLIRTYGKNFTPADVMEGWMSWIPFMPVCTAERVAYRNAAMGLLPPDTASYRNPYREWIGAQIRGDLFGYIHPGNPKAAAEMAYRDACIAQVKNGIYGEMFIAAMIAAAAVTDDLRTVVETGLMYIPEKSRLTADIRKVLALYDEGKTAEEIIEAIHAVYDENTENGWCYTNPNAMIVAMAVLCGGKDFGRSICLAVQAAFDTDCNGATVGSILGIMLGEDSIDPVWYAPFEKRLRTTIEGYNLVEVDELAEMTMKLIG